MLGKLIKPLTLPVMTTVLCLLAFLYQAEGQNLLAVLDLSSDGSVPQKNLTAISDTISKIIAADTSYSQFDRSIIPDLLKQLALDESSSSCFNPQCLALIGSLIGANTVVGGFIRYKQHIVDIELYLVDVATKATLNSVSLSSRTKKAELLGTELPAQIKKLMNPDATPIPPPVFLYKKKNFFEQPWPYIGAFLACGAAGGAYYYENYYKHRNDPTNPPEEPPLSMDDVPVRTR